MKGFYTVTEFAEKTGVTRQTVVNWINNKKIKKIQLPNGHYRIPELEFKKILGEV